MLSSDPRLPRALRGCWLAFAAAVGAYVAVLGVEAARGSSVLAVETHLSLQFALLVCGVALVLARALILRDGRPTWLILGIGLGAWMVGQLVATVQSPGEQPAFPSAMDVGLLAFYVAQYAAFFLLARSGLRRVTRATWLDGAIAILLLGTAGAHWLFTPLVDSGGTVSAAVITIIYPAADVVLLALVLCVAALHGGRPGAVWWAIALGLMSTTAADAMFALQSTAGTEPNTTTGPLAMLYTVGGAILVAAAMRPPSKRPERSLDGWRALAIPTGFSILVLGFLVFDAVAELAPAADVLLTVAITVIGVRAVLAFRENIQLADSRRLAMTDELTGLPNRRSAYAELDKRCATIGPVAVLMIDLDRFKELNDTLGHLVGDEALIAVAERLTAAIGDAGRLSRLGGDEFAVVVASGKGEREALAIARRVLNALDEPLFLDELHLPLRASIGVASAVGHARGGREALLRCADVAMYHAKSNGSGVEVYAAERDGHSRDRLELASELQDAITTGQLVLHFQPKARVRTGEIVGVEALVRWQHPVRGLVAPDDFIPLVERSGLGRLLTLEVVAQALQAERAWRAEGLHVPVAVNISATTLLDVRFPDDVDRLLTRWKAPAGALQLELTEETIMTDPERAQDVLALLSELGIELSLDDFGTGYSSLSMLKRLPVRELKIDRSFVMDLLDDPGDAAIVRSTVDLARNLGLRVVAEGVESAEAWALLAEWGCDLAQGYHLSRPLPAHELRGLLAEYGLRVA